VQKTIFRGLILAVLLLPSSQAWTEWVVLEDFWVLPTWDSIYEGGAAPWALDGDDLWHEFDSNAGLYDHTSIVCKVYNVTSTATGAVRVSYMGAIANGYGTTACVCRAGTYTATDCATDYAAEGLFNDWLVVAHSRESPHTVGQWDSSWHVSNPVAVDTTGETTLSVCWVFVAAFGTTPAGWFDDLEANEALALALPTGVPERVWMMY
jgi:hypothetical protein